MSAAPSTNDVTSAELAIALGADYVMSFTCWCALANISLSTGKRLCARGRGPRLTRTSERRKGVTFADHRAWLEQRVIDGDA